MNLPKMFLQDAEVSPEEFKTLMNGCAVRTMDENAEAFKDGDTYVSLNEMLFNVKRLFI